MTSLYYFNSGGDHVTNLVQVVVLVLLPSCVANYQHNLPSASPRAIISIIAFYPMRLVYIIYFDDYLTVVLSVILTQLLLIALKSE